MKLATNRPHEKRVLFAFCRASWVGGTRSPGSACDYPHIIAVTAAFWVQVAEGRDFLRSDNATFMALQETYSGRIGNEEVAPI